MLNVTNAQGVFDVGTAQGGAGTREAPTAHRQAGKRCSNLPPNALLKFAPQCAAQICPPRALLKFGPPMRWLS
eukprot:1180117-Prorocentrum_minimum.AAC.3